MKIIQKKFALSSLVLASTLALTLSACSNPGEGGEGSASKESAAKVTASSDGGVVKPSPRSAAATGESKSARTGAEEGNSTGAVRSVDYGSLQQVSQSLFGSNQSQSFKYVNDGRSGECFISDASVTCIGTPDSSVPDVDMPPFSGRPGAITLTFAGLAYTIVEGAPPAARELESGQWVDFGTFKCAKPDDASLVCESEVASFEIRGKDRRILTQGPVSTPEELAKKKDTRPATEFHTGTDVLVKGPMMCGAMEGHRLAEVISGEITCAEAMDVLDQYDSKARSEGQGNTLSVEFDGWFCSSPTFRRAEELQATTVCENVERGITVHAPK